MGPGIYIHIPFCRRACTYCDFHFSTLLRYTDEVIQAIEKEIILREDEWKNTIIPTVYLGGGTPSLLSVRQLEKILKPLWQKATWADTCEVTLEANPEDIQSEKLKPWRSLGINRISLGIQSLRDEVLRWMNRGHSGSEALAALKHLQEAGFLNLNVDLIYGIPNLSTEAVLEDLQKILAFNPTHLSCYELTCEPRTAYAHQVKCGKISPPPEERVCEQFLAISEWLESHGFNHYEVSNYSRPCWEARHNLRYWYGLPTLGFGPSAVSFDGLTRRKNVANNARYVHAISEGTLPAETEILSRRDQYNEFVLTRLRLKEGIKWQEIREKFGEEKENLIKERADSWPQKWKELTCEALILTREGRLVADRLAAELFEV
jgi:oxygen-independent coproporphyrinogen-3 oxidase